MKIGKCEHCNGEMILRQRLSGVERHQCVLCGKIRMADMPEVEVANDTDAAAVTDVPKDQVKLKAKKKVSAE